MSKMSDQAYLLTNQYKNAANLNARFQLHALFSTNKYGWHQWVFDHFNLAAPSRILELGCGSGYLWLENLERIPQSWEITLSDFSAGMVDQAQVNLQTSQRPFNFETIDAQSIPYDDETFDAVIANHMLYHVPDMARALVEMRRVLKPGGRFYASTVGEMHMRELDELARKFEPDVALLFDGDQTHAFTLENGADHLSPWFSRVTLHQYEDALEITSAEPLVAYVLSMLRLTETMLVGNRIAEFTDFIKQELARHGSIHVSKASGLFEAVRMDDERIP
ncbi:MAG: methyltransferase domain-containing protein [Anaerolineae bacterium]|nr:methyltransferase domain-containing protein [Anaerolineae bacterium]